MASTVVAGLLCAPAAQAARIPVLGAGKRSDPGVAAVDRTPAPAPDRQVRTYASASARKTALKELRRMRREGDLDAATYAGYRDAYKDAKAFAGRLSGARKVEMTGQLRNLDQMAARGSLTPSRLVPLFLQLQRNREWWSKGALLASGARVSFPGSELVYQYFPGEGLQIHPLANFGKLNALWRSKVDADRMRQLMEELLPLAASRAGGTAWEYYFDFGGGAPPWVSGLAQGTGLQSMARAATKSGQTDVVFPVLRAGLKVFETRTPSGVRVPAGAGTHYAQYSFAPGLRILNGFTQSLVGLFDFATLAADPDAQRLFDAGNRRLLQELPTYDTGAWSLYSRGTSQKESDLNYHGVARDFLKSLCDRTGIELYCDTVANFNRYLKEVPGVEIVTRSLKAGKPGALKFKLSKIARVSLSLRRNGKVVYSYSGTLGYGTRAVTVTPPKKAGEYDVRISATDLAGNTGVYTDFVTVRK